MKKVLILAMSCEKPFFRQEEWVVRHRSYGRDVLAGAWPDADFWTYGTSSDGEVRVNTKTHRISVPADDSLRGTYQKTMLAFETVKALGLEFDWVFRTNLSTFTNVPLLLNFCEGIPDSERETIFSSHVYCTRNGSGPDEWDPYALGNSMLFSKTWLDRFLEFRMENAKPYDRTPERKPGEEPKSIYAVDDNAMGFAANVWAELNGRDKFSLWKNFAPFREDTDTEDGIPHTPKAHVASAFRTYEPGVPREREFAPLERAEEECRGFVPGETPEKTYRRQTRRQRLTLIDFGGDSSYYSLVRRSVAEKFARDKSGKKSLKNFVEELEKAEKPKYN